MPNVLYEKDGRIARIILNRPEVMNAIDLEMPQAIEEAVPMPTQTCMLLSYLEQGQHFVPDMT